MTLLEEIEGADRDFQRPAVPSVYAEYELFIASGRYPYIDAVVKEIADKYDVGDPACRAHNDVLDPINRKLSHEVYLASGQHRVKEMEAQEAAFAAEGFLPITDLVPADGMRIVLSREPDKVYRLVRAQRDDWCLLAPRKRTAGISLRGLCDQHTAYLAAREERQTRMNGPAVRMYRPA